MFRFLCVALVALGIGLKSEKAEAQVDPYLGQIMMVGFNFCPRGWAEANGQLLPISQNTALFSLLGTAFGGDGRTTFALPDLRGRTAKHVGSGPGLNTVSWGQRGGIESKQLNSSELPSHNHRVVGTASGRVVAAEEDADTEDPNGALLAVPESAIYGSPANQVNMAAGSATVDIDINSQNTGNSTSFDIRNPYLGIYHCIATQGIFPSRS